jgi:hypothetical protein
MRRDSPDDGDIPGQPHQASLTLPITQSAQPGRDLLHHAASSALPLHDRTGSLAYAICRETVLRRQLGRMHDHLSANTEEQTLLEGISQPVAGPSVIFPRGYLWGAPLWSAVALAYLALTHWPWWFKADLAAGLLAGLVIFILAMSNLTFRAFSADRTEVRIGLPASTKRHGKKRRAVRHIPWQQIDRVKIASRPFGVRLDIVLGPNAALSNRGYQSNLAFVTIHRVLLLVIPFWYLCRPTGLISPLERPARYRVILRETTVDEMRRSFRAIAPPEVTIAVLVRRGASVSSAKAAPGGIRQSA